MRKISTKHSLKLGRRFYNRRTIDEDVEPQGVALEAVTRSSRVMTPLGTKRPVESEVMRSSWKENCVEEARAEAVTLSRETVRPSTLTPINRKCDFKQNLKRSLDFKV